jgi:iron-sulfur cluster assembly protein CyaY
MLFAVCSVRAVCVAPGWIRDRLRRLWLLRLYAGRRIFPQVQRSLLSAAGDGQRQRGSKRKESHKIRMLAPMNETEFDALAGQALARVEAALEASGVDADFELKEGGVLEIEFADRSKIIVNRHGAARQVWIAARAGGFHFSWDGVAWRDTRDGTELFAALSKLVSAQSGRPVLLHP